MRSNAKQIYDRTKFTHRTTQLLQDLQIRRELLAANGSPNAAEPLVIKVPVEGKTSAESPIRVTWFRVTIHGKIE